jgi:hypothetical protein
MMKIAGSILFFVTLTYVSVYSMPPSLSPGGKKYPSSYKEQVTIDGNAADWDLSRFNYNKNSNLFYAVANDSTCLYLCVRVVDEKVQKKLMRSGMTIWFDPRGKKKELTGIHYPLGTGTKQKDIQPVHQANAQPDKKKEKLMYLLQLEDMELIGFKENLNGFINHKNNTTGFLASVDWDSLGVLVYEARVPVSAFNEDIRKSEPLSVGFFIKGLENPNAGKEAATSEPPRDTELGRTPVPGAEQRTHGSMLPSGRPGETDPMYDDIEFWYYITIAKKSIEK